MQHKSQCKLQDSQIGENDLIYFSAFLIISMIISGIFL